MGLLGDILYPDNKDLAEDLNKKYTQLLTNNTLHNGLVNSYSELSESVRKFNAQMMALLCYQYLNNYDPEKLDDVPQSNTPKLDESIADRIELYAGGVLALKQTLSCLNAMRQGVVNLYRNAGTYKAKIGESYDSFKASMQDKLDLTRYKANISRAGNVDLLTEQNRASFTEIKSEIKPAEMTTLGEGDAEEGSKAGSEEGAGASSEEGAGAASEAGAGAGAEAGAGAGAGAEVATEAVAPEVAEAVNVSATGAELGAAAGTEIAAAESESMVAAVGGAVCSILEGACVIALVVTEIIGAVRAGELNDKLKKAEVDMDKTLETQQTSLKTLKDAFDNLLLTATNDIKEYNVLIRDELDLAQSYQTFFNQFDGYAPNVGFHFEGLTIYRDSLPTIAYDQIAILQRNADEDLEQTIECITEHAEQFGTDTQIVLRIKAMLKANNKDDIYKQDGSIDNDLQPFIKELEAEFSVDDKKIAFCNQKRKFLNAIAAKMESYHKAIKDLPQKTGAKTKQPDVNPIDVKSPPNPSYKPDPKDFDLPQ